MTEYKVGDKFESRTGTTAYKTFEIVYIHGNRISVIGDPNMLDNGPGRLATYDMHTIDELYKKIVLGFKVGKTYRPNNGSAWRYTTIELRIGPDGEDYALFESEYGGEFSGFVSLKQSEFRRMIEV